MLAWLCLLGAVLSFGSASLLQASGARKAEASGGGMAFVLDLARSGSYAAGTALDFVAVFLTAVALRDLPLFLVQGATASSLVLTALGSALVFPAERNAGLWRPAIAVSLGLALLGSSAAEGPSARLSPLALVVLASGALVILGLRPILDRTVIRPGVRCAILAGLSYAGMGISLRALQVPAETVRVVTQPAAWIAVGFLAMALVFFGRALQLGSVTQSMAIVVSIDTILPAGIGVWLLGDRARSGGGAAALIGLALTIGAVLWLLHMTRESAEHCPPVSLEHVVV